MSEPKCVLGIDPGLSGGLAVIGPDGLWLEPMPRTVDGDLDLDELRRLIGDWYGEISNAFVEKVHAMPKQGVSSMFTFGRSYGAILGMLAAFDIHVVHVRPQEWQKEMHEGFAGEPKDRSRAAFAELFPGVNAKRTPKCKGPDEGLVEAALIAEFGRRKGFICIPRLPLNSLSKLP
jgi:hypothetical protein